MPSGNAGNSDATIAVLGISSLLEGEEGESLASSTAGDRFDYNLPANQIDYLKKLRKAADKNPVDKKPIVAVITGGSPMNLAEVQELAPGSSRETRSQPSRHACPSESLQPAV